MGTRHARIVRGALPAANLPGRTGLVEYPYPLRETGSAYLRLPSDLKVAEVKRLAAFMMTFAVDAEIA